MTASRRVVAAAALRARVTSAADWLRRRLGPHPDVAADLAHARSELAVVQHRLLQQATRHAAAMADAQQRVDAAVRHERGAQRALWAAYEPTTTGECTKARLRDEQEATRYARKVEHDTGSPPRSLRGYRCKLCPRQPITSDRFWHVANVDPAMRSGRPEAERVRAARRAEVRQGPTIGDRVQSGGAS